VSVVPVGVSLAGAGLEREQLVELQRARLLAAAVGAVDELGYAGVTVGCIVERSRVSRRTFYELFADRDECLAAVLDNALVRVQGELAVVGSEGVGVGLEGLSWCERVRRGLWTVLCFLDREPALARVCVVHSAQAGPLVQRRREAVLTGLVGVVDEGRLQAGRGARGVRGECCGPLVAEGVVGAVFAIIARRLRQEGREPLAGLLGELMGIVVLPYLGSGAARRERERSVPAPAVVPRAAVGGSGRVARGTVSPLNKMPMRLTYRTARVLVGVGERPGGSNREVAERAGISDPAQISKLLTRLERLGLLVNGSDAHVRGGPNAWRLSERGESLAQSIGAFAVSSVLWRAA
jgi:AcrR family transcriptional regulator